MDACKLMHLADNCDILFVLIIGIMMTHQIKIKLL